MKVRNNLRKLEVGQAMIRPVIDPAGYTQPEDLFGSYELVTNTKATLHAREDNLLI